MKKTAKKMALNRETLANLERLGQVAGGATDALSFCVCLVTGQPSCKTCVNTCTTNLC